MKKLVFLFLCAAGLQAQSDQLFKNIQRANRRVNSQLVRNTATNFDAQQALAAQATNGDEALYADKRNSFGKSLLQQDSGLIYVPAFNQMVLALTTGTQANFNAIMMGTSPVQRRLIDPQAAYAFVLDGADGWIHSMPAAPTLASAETAGEMVELYWHALLRDVFFNDYDTSPLAAAAVADLNRLQDFKGPKVNGRVIVGSLFRGNTAGDLVGPFISQFLYKPIPYGPGPNFDGSGVMPTRFQMQIVPASGTINDFMTTFDEWHFIQQGNYPTTSLVYTGSHFIRNARDLGDYVHQDFPAQPYLNAAQILLDFGAPALDPANPYLNNPTQQGFVTYNAADILTLVSMASEIALKTSWYQKWIVHRRARPEFLGFLANQQKSGAQDFGLHSDLINSDALNQIFATFGSYFLPQAYPEGSPPHPSYPAGHSTIAGAAVTILKAFFNEDFPIPGPCEPNAANTELVAYTGGVLRVGDELNKLAFNIALGRDYAGVHFRTDGWQSILLGEKVAIALLNDESFTRNIPFSGYSLTTFEGNRIVVGAKQNINQLN